MIDYQWIVRSFYFSLIFVSYLSAEWPSISSSSQFQLLGLFADSENASKSNADSIHSRAMFKSAILLADRYNITINGQSIGWQIAQTSGDVVNALKESCLKISTWNIVGIVGPELSRESHVIAPFAKNIEIPVISFSATDPGLSDRREYPSFFRTIPSDDTAALAIVDLFIEYNWTSCVIIYQNDAFGSGGVKFISEQFSKKDLTIVNLIVFDIMTLSIKGDLKSLLMGSSTRIVLVWAQSSNLEIIVQTALKKNVLGPRFVWILSSNIPLERFNRNLYNELVGLFTVQAVVGNVIDAPVNKTLLNKAYQLWQQYEPESFPGSENVRYYALFAFDATWALITALEKYCSTRTTNDSSSCLSFTNTSFCFDRQLIHGVSLYDMLQDYSFLGVSGWIEFDRNVTNRINGTYYIARNIQRSLSEMKYFPVSVWSNAKGWYPYSSTSMIVWPGNTLTRPTGYADISGTVLRVAVVLTEGFTSISYITGQSGNISKLVGYMPDLINLLQDKMGFVANISALPPNQSYHEMVDWIANGIYDIVVADLTITAARREKVTFSSSIFDNSLRIVIRKSSDIKIDLLSYLKPFSWTVWLTLLGTIIYAGLIFCLLERRENLDLQNRPIPSLIAMSIWYVIAIMLGCTADFSVSTAPGRVLTIGLYIVCLISVAAYTANLASDLTISNTKYVVTGLDDLRNGKIAHDRIGILVHTSIEDFYLREISNGVRDFYPLETKQQMFASLFDNTIDVSIMDGGFLEYVTNNIFCNLTLVGADFDQSSFGIAYQKKWQYGQQLDVAILSLSESGEIDNLKTKWFHGDACQQLSDEPLAVTVISMAGLLFTFGVFALLALLLYLWVKRFVLKKSLIILIRSFELLKMKGRTSFSRERQKDISDDHVFDSKSSSSPIVM